MERAVWVALGTGSLISCAAMIGIGNAASGESPTISREHYDAAIAGIDAARPEVIALCDSARTGKELCRVTAEADEMVRVAELAAKYRRGQASARSVQRARIEAKYQVERAKCATAGGIARDRCLV